MCNPRLGALIVLLLLLVAAPARADDGLTMQDKFPDRVVVPKGTIYSDEALPAPPGKPKPMMRVVLLTLVFADGSHDGSTPMGYYRRMEKCQAEGNQIALQFTEQGHPATALCAWKTTLKSREKLIRD